MPMLKKMKFLMNLGQWASENGKKQKCEQEEKENVSLILI
jgi:hypothetical protein